MNAQELWRVLGLSPVPVLVYGAGADELTTNDCAWVDLRATDLPTAALAMRIALTEAWRRDSRLVVRIDAEPSDAVVSVLFEASRRAFNVAPPRVERFGEERTLTVLTSAPTVSPALAAMFSVRVPVARLEGLRSKEVRRGH